MNKGIRLKNYLLSLTAIAVLVVIGACSSAGAGDGDDPANASAPTVSLTMPAHEATGVAINSTITATFSEAMVAATVNTNFTLTNGTTSVDATVTYNADLMTATLVPSSDLAASTLYTATLATGATDEAGNPLEADKVWTFTTGTAADNTAPTVTSTSPAGSATGIARNSTIRATFSEAMNPATIGAATFTLKNGSTSVSGTVTYDIPTKTATIAPESLLAEETEYTATVTTGVTDEAGNAMATANVWTFTTAVAGIGPEPVNLGTAGTFAILAKTAISTVPASDITGDIGLSPAATSFITGFSLTDWTGYATSDQVTGFVYAADMAPPTPINMTTAVSNMETAYTDAAGRVTPDFTNQGAGEIGGLTLTPGLYNWNTGVTISSGVTISGGANDVWIFQVANDLTVAAGVNVTLSDGALPRNIFWQVAGEATLGTGAHFEGVLLSKTAIVLANGATTNGRLLAQSQVTLDQATVTEPTE
jgi:hypothetical protein